MSTLKVNAIRGTGASSDAISVNSSDGTCTVKATNNLSNRRININGAMTISQRGATGHTGDGYSLDMFARQQSSDGAFTITQSTTSPDGFSKSLKVDVTTADTSLAASQYAQIKTKIEAQDLQKLAYGTSAAKTITISFYVRSNKTGNYGFSVNQSDNSFKQVTYQYAISSADTWERKSFTITGDTSGVINDDTGDGFIISWGLAAGTNRTSGSLRSTWTAHASADQYAGQGVNLLDSTSNEWYLTGVQVEISDHVTDFEFRSYGDELQRCKRYYQQIVYASGNEYRLMNASVYDNSNPGAQCYGVIHFPVEMRAAPELAGGLSGTDYWRHKRAYNGGHGAEIFDTIDLKKSSTTTAELKGSGNFDGGQNGATGTVYTNNASASLGLQAEL